MPSFGSIGAGVTVDGGSSGDNTISAALVNSNNAADIKDFQILDVSGYGGPSPLDASLLSTPITGVAISSASTNGTATLINLAAAVTVTDTHAERQQRADAYSCGDRRRFADDHGVAYRGQTL